MEFILFILFLFNNEKEYSTKNISILFLVSFLLYYFTITLRYCFVVGKRYNFAKTLKFQTDDQVNKERNYQVKTNFKALL